MLIRLIIKKAAELEYEKNPEATELRKVIWRAVKDADGHWMPLSHYAEREDITIKEKISLTKHKN